MDRNLAELKKSKNPGRALLVVTAGFDDHFLPDRDNQFIDPNIPIYLIFLRTARFASGSDPSSTNSPAEATKGSVLTELVSRTRGDYFLITPDKIEAQLLQLAMDLKNDYVVGFKSTNGAKNNTWRKLKMKVTSPSGQNLGTSIKDKYFVQKP